MVAVILSRGRWGNFFIFRFVQEIGRSGDKFKQKCYWYCRVLFCILFYVKLAPQNNRKQNTFISWIVSIATMMLFAINLGNIQQQIAYHLIVYLPRSVTFFKTDLCCHRYCIKATLVKRYLVPKRSRETLPVLKTLIHCLMTCSCFLFGSVIRSRDVVMRSSYMFFFSSISQIRLYHFSW